MYNMPAQLAHEKNPQIGLKISIIKEEERNSIIRMLNTPDVIKAHIVLVSDLDAPGWTEPAVMAKISGLDLSEGGLILVDKYYNNPEFSQKQLHHLYTFDTVNQLQEVLHQFEEAGLDAEAVMLASAKKQTIDFGEKTYDYPVKSNF
jgi:hypothetical protein